MVCVIGEALIDLVAETQGNSDASSAAAPLYRAHPGGSPFNVAIGLSRLGRPTMLQARLSDDAFGRQLRAHAQRNGVDLSLAVAADEPSTLAIVGLDENHNATYDFYLNGTADWQWTAAELDRAPRDTPWIHTGSLASWTLPGCGPIAEHLSARRSAGARISYDPNIRPLLMPDHAAGVASVEAMVARADVVKASAEDLKWLYPDRGIEQALRSWRALGPRLVVVTEGGNGAHALGELEEVVSVAARPVTVVDTVGAGDAFMSGLIHALVGKDLDQLTVSAEDISSAVADAILVAALTVSKAGANPPTAEELDRVRGIREPQG